MKAISTLEQAIHENSVTPGLISAALVEAKQAIIERTQILSQPGALAPELHLLDTCIAGADHLAASAMTVEAAADLSPIGDTKTDESDVTDSSKDKKKGGKD